MLLEFNLIRSMLSLIFGSLQKNLKSNYFQKKKNYYATQESIQFPTSLKNNNQN